MSVETVGSEDVTRPDPEQPAIITVLGRNRSGKSKLASVLWSSWPYDRLCIDPAGDAETGPEVRDLHAEDLEGRFPVDDEQRVSLRFRPDVGSPTYLDDLDRAVGFAYNHPFRIPPAEGSEPAASCLLWADEVEELTSGAKTPPFMRRALAMNRHRGLTMLLCGQRAKNIHPKVISNARWLYLFEMPNPNDRERIAECIGCDEPELTAALFALGQHEYLRWDAMEREMIHFPPLPLRNAA